MNPLSPAWRASLEEAWSAYLEGSLPIGACVTDDTGRVLSVGRNRLGEPRREDGVTFRPDPVLERFSEHTPTEMALARQLHAAGTLRRLRHQRAGLDAVLAALA